MFSSHRERVRERIVVQLRIRSNTNEISEMGFLTAFVFLQAAVCLSSRSQLGPVHTGCEQICRQFACRSFGVTWILRKHTYFQFNVFHYLHQPVVSCSASCVNGYQRCRAPDSPDWDNCLRVVLTSVKRRPSNGSYSVTRDRERCADVVGIDVSSCKECQG